MMKICMVNPFSKFAAVRQYNLAKALTKKGHEVTLILPWFDQYSGFKPLKFEKMKNLRIVHPTQLKSRILEVSMFFYIPSAIRKAMKHKFDIVHAFRPTPFSGYIGHKIAKKQGIPFILEMGDIESETMASLKTHPSYRVKIVQYLEKKLLQKADGITVMTPKVEAYVRKRYTLQKKIAIVSNGVDSSLFKPKKVSQLKKELQQKTNAKKILMYAGKLDHVSHIKDLVKVMQKLDKSFGLVVVGDGKNKHELSSYSHKLKIGKRIHFVGRIQNDQVPDYLNAADILLAPFKKERGVEFASNLKIFEYMAIGKPIIASDVGMLKDVLNGCGYVYKAGDINRLHMFCMKSKKEMGGKAREKARKEYDWNVLAKKNAHFL